MEDYYSILNINKSSTSDEIEESYNNLSVIRHNIGDNDYDNIHEVLRIEKVKEAYKVLRDRCNRFKYDIHNFGGVQYIDTNFINKSDISSFIDVVKDEITYLDSDLRRKDTLIIGLYGNIDNLVNQSIIDKTDFGIKYEIERNRSRDLENNINDLSSQIDNLKSKIKVLENIEKEKSISENKMLLAEKHNQHLLQKIKNNKHHMFKMMAITISICLFVILLICLNI